MPDGFVEGYSPEVRASSSKTTESASLRVPLKGVQEVIETMKSFCNKELVQGVKGVFEFHLTGKEPGVWHLDLKNNAGELKFAEEGFHKSPVARVFVFLSRHLPSIVSLVNRYFVHLDLSFCYPRCIFH